MMTPIMYVVLCFVPSGILSLGLEWWHHCHAGDKRAPLKDKLLRPPGESSRRKLEQLDDTINEILIWVVGFPCTLWMYYLSSTGTREALHTFKGMWIPALALALAVFGGFAGKLVQLIRERTHARLNFIGERAVGEHLNQLMCDGCRVIHDFPLGEGGNIDHIIIAPAGVFAVETRLRRKNGALATRQAQEVLYDGAKLEFPFHTETRDVARACDQAAVLGKFLSETFRVNLPAQPLLALPGWQVIARGHGELRVLNPKMIAAVVLAPVAAPLAAERIHEITAMLELKCRDVEF